MRLKPLPLDQDAQESLARSGGSGTLSWRMQSLPYWKATRSTTHPPSGRSSLRPKRLPQARQGLCEPAQQSIPSAAPFRKLAPTREQSSMPPYDRFPWCFERGGDRLGHRRRNTSTDSLRAGLCGGLPFITTILITSLYVNDVRTCPIYEGIRTFKRDGKNRSFVTVYAFNAQRSHKARLFASLKGL